MIIKNNKDVNNKDFNNVDYKTIKSFGDEWTKYDQSKLKFEDSLRYFIF